MRRSRGDVTHATAIRYRRRRGTLPFTTRVLVLEVEGVRAFFAPPPFSSHLIRLQLKRPTDTRHCWAEMGMTACKGSEGTTSFTPLSIQDTQSSTQLSLRPAVASYTHTARPLGHNVLRVLSSAINSCKHSQLRNGSLQVVGCHDRLPRLQARTVRH